MFKRLNELLPDGLFPFWAKILSGLEKLSINYWLKVLARKSGLTDKSGKKAPRWVSEIWQILLIVLGVIALNNVQLILSINAIVIFVLILFIYRLAEILVFLLNWVFVHEGEVHYYRRSVLGFLLNIFEVSLYSSIVTLLLGYVTKPTSSWDIVYQKIVGILTLSPYPEVTNSTHKWLSMLELTTASLLILVVLAGLVGEVMRGEIGNKSDNDI